MSFEEKLKKYAEVVVKVGLNLQSEQRLFVFASIESAPLVHLITEYAYKQNSKLVSVIWEDKNLDLIRFQKPGLFKNINPKLIAGFGRLAQKDIAEYQKDLIKIKKSSF